MSTRIPTRDGGERLVTLAVLMREAFVALNEVVMGRLAEQGHSAVRSAHSAVFQYLDDTGTTVSLLAERARMTKQAMAELVQHLEAHGYVRRVPDPRDRRAKLVLPTDRGREVLAIARGLVPELEERVGGIVGVERLSALKADLDAIRRGVGG
ncbi:MarR family transcriptional regulator [Pseudonocardia sp.]|uniref:MarR family transcriptional regulator n=1 Tax=Pseudonocardia sp. TaxID=60912 RepID=UPI003D0EB349